MSIIEHIIKKILELSATECTIKKCKGYVSVRIDGKETMTIPLCRYPYLVEDIKKITKNGIIEVYCGEPYNLAVKEEDSCLLLRRS